MTCDDDMSNERIHILYIDDEINNLNSFRASFRKLYDIHTARNAIEAREILKENDIHVILADQRMPVTSGVDFFNSILDTHPEPIRILLTAYANIEALVSAINKGQIFQFIPKPWDEYELQNSIQNAFGYYKAKKELREKVEELQKSNDELSRFIYSISHDLRSPLMSLLGIINLAKSDQSVTDPNGYLRLIEKSLLRMDDFIENIIEYYKNSRIQSDYEIISFRQLVEDAIESCKHHNPEVVFHTEIREEDSFIGDSFRIGIILNNLISNAVKYQRSDEPDPRVEVRITADGQQAHITISDNGTGIPEAHMEQLFKRFFHSRSDTRPGSGIGLYIVKEALGRIQGEVSVQSVVGRGTTFEVSIPSHRVAEP